MSCKKTKRNEKNNPSAIFEAPLSRACERKIESTSFFYMSVWMLFLWIKHCCYWFLKHYVRSNKFLIRKASKLESYYSFKHLQCLSRDLCLYPIWCCCLCLKWTCEVFVCPTEEKKFVLLLFCKSEGKIGKFHKSFLIYHL